MPNKRGKVKVREKTLKRLRKGMSENEDREVRSIRETCRWDKGDVNKCVSQKGSVWDNEGRKGKGKEECWKALVGEKGLERGGGGAKRKRKKSTPMRLKAQTRGKSHQESRYK